MDIVHKQKLSKIFPDVELVIALSGGITKHEYRIEVEENEDDAVLTNESVVITVTVIEIQRDGFYSGPISLLKPLEKGPST